MQTAYAISLEKVASQHARVLGSLPQQPKRVYMADVMVLQYLAKRGMGYSKRVAQHFSFTRRCANKHLQKLETLGLIQRIGRRRCPFQWYRITRETEIPVHAILTYLIDLFVSKPHRNYFSFNFVVATVPSSYRPSGPLERIAGASVPYNAKPATVPFFDEPAYLPLWIPFDCFEDVVWFLDELDIVWHLKEP